MTDIDPAEVMAAHRRAGDICAVCMRTDEDGNPDVCRWPCEPYRLSEALAIEPDRTRAAVAQAEAQLARALEQLAAERSAHEQTRDDLAQTEQALEMERSAYNATEALLCSARAELRRQGVAW